MPCALVGGTWPRWSFHSFQFFMAVLHFDVSVDSFVKA